MHNHKSNLITYTEYGQKYYYPIERKKYVNIFANDDGYLFFAVTAVKDYN